MVEGRGELAYPRAVPDVVLAVDDDCGRRDGHDVVVDVVVSMMCRWKWWPLVVDPDDGANARTEGTTVRRHSSAPVEAEEVLGLLVDFMAHQAKNDRDPNREKSKWNESSNRASQLCVILADSG